MSTGIDTAAARTTAYLAGRGTLPRGTEAIPYQWIVAARGRDLQACGAKETAPGECLKALGGAGGDALMGAADSFLRSGELAVALVGSGLAALRIREVADPAAVRPVWRRALLCALLLTAPLLPYLSGDPACTLLIGALAIVRAPATALPLTTPTAARRTPLKRGCC
ncbi:hypothetical protein [Streptomyces sp. NPDC052107]|uniref:hypothetical protein n=1 Tax=Streptomyces sp. NPDC052107 TaxID=3155632 RepID=UPI00344906F2